MALSVTNRGTFTSGSLFQNSTLTFNAPQTFTAGMAVMVLAFNNSGGGGAYPSSVTVTDSNGNTWTSVLQILNDPSQAYNGVAGTMFYTNQNGGLITTSTTITIVFGGSSQNAIRGTLTQISSSAGSVTCLTTGTTSNWSGGTTPTITLGYTGTNLPSTGNVVLGGVAINNVFGTYTPDTDTLYGSWTTVQTISGTALSNVSMALATQFKVIGTGTGTLTFDGSWTNAADKIGYQYLFGEVTAGAYTIIANTRAFADTFINANLLKGFKQPYVVGALTITRNPANFNKGFILIANVRAFTITRNPANFIYPAKLLAESKAINIIEYDVNLIYPKKLIAESASINIVEYNIEFWYDIFATQGYALDLESRSFILLGTETPINKIGDPSILPPEGSGNPFPMYFLYADTRYVQVNKKSAGGIVMKIASIYADTGSPTGTWSGTFGTRFNLINDITDTTGASVLTHGTTAGAHDFLHQFLSNVPTNSVINSLVHRYIARRNGGATSVIRSVLGIRNATNQIVKYTPTTYNTPINGTYSAFTQTWLVNPATNQNFTIAQVTNDSVGNGGTNGLLAGLFGLQSNDANPTVSIASASVRITYTMPVLNQYLLIADSRFIDLETFIDITPLRKNSRLLAERLTITSVTFEAFFIRKYNILIESKSILTSFKNNLFNRTYLIPISVRNLITNFIASNFRFNKRLVADVVQFNYNFIGATFQKNYSLLAQKSSYTTAFINNNFKRTYIFPIEVKNIIVTGNLVYLTYVQLFYYTMNVFSYSLNTAYNNVNLLVQRKILIDRKQFATSFIQATLIKISIYKMVANVYSFIVTGINNVIKTQRKLLIDTRNLYVTGNVIDIRKEIRFSVQSRAYNITRFDAGLKVKAGIVLKMWNGSQWIKARLKIWDGTNWIGELKRWDGTQWKNK